MGELTQRFSLLYADGAEREELYPPSIPLPDGILPEDPEIRAVTEPILRRKTTRQDWIWRKEILEDFLQSPGLMLQCEEVLRKWESLPETAARERIPESTDFEAALETLKENTVSLMEHLRFLRSAAEDLKTFAPESAGLFSFAEFVRCHAESAELQSLAAQIGSFPLLRPEQAKTVLSLSTDAGGAVTGTEILYLGTDESRYWKKEPFRKEIFGADLPRIRIPEQAAEGVNRLSETFLRLTAAIRRSFDSLRDGLIFYRYALSRVEEARTRNRPWCLASPDGRISPSAEDLWDLQHSLPVITLEDRGWEAWEGAEGRDRMTALATLQILGAAALPLPARKARFLPEGRILRISGADREELADRFRKVKPGNLLLFESPRISLTEELAGAFVKKGAALRVLSETFVH